MIYTFDFIPDYWQPEWHPDDTDPFVVEYEYEEGDPDVGLADSFSITLTHKGVDITDTLNALNAKQLLKDVQDHFITECEQSYDYDVSEYQEWRDFNPDC